MTTMKGLWLEDEILFYREDLPIPDIKEGEALVQVKLAGICATDLEMLVGYYPYTGIPGHEFVGEIVAAPRATQRVGQRVVGEINISCGKCETCRAGRPTHCERRAVLGILGRNGVFAEYTTLPLENLHPVPPELADELAVFVEPVAAALEIPSQVQVQPTDRVLVVGAGRLGQLIAQALTLTGCDLRVSARYPQQRKLLTDRGIRVVSEDQIETGKMDLVVEATGSPDGFQLARRAVRPRGTIVMKSTYKGEISVNFSSLVVDEITLVGSRCGPFPPAIRLLAEKKINPAPLIQACYSFAEGVDAFEQAWQGGIMKVLLKP